MLKTALVVFALSSMAAAQAQLERPEAPVVAITSAFSSDAKIIVGRISNDHKLITFEECKIVPKDQKSDKLALDDCEYLENGGLALDNQTAIRFDWLFEQKLKSYLAEKGLPPVSDQISGIAIVPAGVAGISVGLVFAATMVTGPWPTILYSMAALYSLQSANLGLLATAKDNRQSVQLGSIELGIHNAYSASQQKLTGLNYNPIHYTPAKPTEMANWN